MLTFWNFSEKCSFFGNFLDEHFILQRTFPAPCPLPLAVCLVDLPPQTSGPCPSISLITINRKSALLQHPRPSLRYAAVLREMHNGTGTEGGLLFARGTH